MFFFLRKRREQTETKVAYMDRPVQVFSKHTVVESWGEKNTENQSDEIERI